MSLLLIHPTGNRNVRAVLAALSNSGQLSGFHSALALGRSARWTSLLPGRFRGELERRRYDLPDAVVHARPWREIVRLVAKRLGWKRLVAHEHGWACVDRVYAALDRAVAAGLRADRTTRAVYAYEDGALRTFTRAKELGIARVYDLPIAYWETGRRLMTEESERLPAWAATLGGGVKDSPAKLARKTRELELADLVVTPSQFVADSLPEWARASKRIVVSPFGSPPPLAASNQRLVTSSEKLEASSQKLGARLRVLFAGSMGQRKGLGDLFAAMRLLNRPDVELVVMGSLQAPMEFYRGEFADFTYEPGRPHAQVLELMRSCDVFCLPSIVEGRALVMQEAMSQGLPIIITPNTGGADLVCEAHEGGTTAAAEPHGGSEGRRDGATDVGTTASEPPASGLRSSGHPASGPLGFQSAEPPASDNRPSAVQTFQSSGPLAIRPSGLPPYGRKATGFLVPIRSPEAIAEAIAWCADHRAETVEMGRAARLKAATYTWEAYGDTVVAAIRGLTSP